MKLQVQSRLSQFITKVHVNASVKEKKKMWPGEGGFVLDFPSPKLQHRAFFAHNEIVLHFIFTSFPNPRLFSTGSDPEVIHPYRSKGELGG